VIDLHSGIVEIAYKQEIRFKMLDTILLSVHVTVAVVLIVIVLFQHGKGASMGSAFGGSSQTLFGSRGPATALAKITTVAAVVFMLTSITLSVISSKSAEQSVLSGQASQADVPVTLPDTNPEQAPVSAGPTGPTSGKIEKPAPPTEPIGPVSDNTASEGSGG